MQKGMVQKITAEHAVVYRVMVQYTIPRQETKEPTEVFFQGSLKELNLRYPKPESRKYDDLAPGFGNSTFGSSTSRWFERKKGETWVRCDDPRTQIPDSKWHSLLRG